MIEHEGKILLTTKEACQVLGRSMEALRQLIYRKRFISYKVRSRLYLDNDEVSTYFTKKYGLPPFEALTGEAKNEPFIGFKKVLAKLNYSESYLRGIVKSGVLKGYCTSDGQILIPESALNRFIGVEIDEAEDL